MILLTVINVLIFFSNAFLVGHLGKVTDMLDDKLVDMSMIESRLEHYFVNLDTAFVSVDSEKCA